MNWFTALANVARLYLEIRAIAARYDLTRRIEADIRADELEVDRLRNLGDPASQLLADRLRDRITRAQGVAATLPGSGPAA